MATLGDLWVYLKGDKSGLDKTLGNAERDIKGFGSRISGFLQNSLSFLTGNLLTSAITKITQAFGGLASGMIGGNQAFEQYETSFEVLIGNAELAAQRIQELGHFGATTPFDLPQVVEGDRVLQAFGLHAADVATRFGKAGDEIRTIAGDVAAGTGSSFQEIANLIGRFSAGATGEAISRMQELGITTRSELSAMGLEFSKSGELVSPLQDAMTVLLQVMQDRFGGMMDAQSQTFGGMLSNFQDWVGQTARILGAPIFDVLKQGLAAFLDFVKPGSPADTVIKEFAETIRLTLGVLGEIGQALVGDVSGQINGFVQSLADGLQRVNDFLRQLKDEIAGLTAGDILAELGPGLEQMHSQMQESLDNLAATHQAALESLEGQVQSAGDRMGQAMADIAEKYGPQIQDMLSRIADTAAGFQERLTDLSEQHARQRANIEKQIAKNQSDLEEKLTQLKKDHMRRRSQLVTSLLTAESEEQYLNIKSQIAAEDDKYKEQVDGAKKAAKEQADELKDRLKEEDQEYQKQEDKLKRQRDKALAVQLSQLDELKGKRAEEEAVVQETYTKEVDLLNQRIAAENAAYATQQDEIKAMFAQQMADFEAEIAARAAAIGTGPAAQVGAFIRTVIDEFHRFKEVVAEFLDKYAVPLTGVLIGIGAVLVGGGVIAAVTALGAALAGISLPILAIIGTVALLYTAWTENWGGIQEKTAAFYEWLTTTTQSTLESLSGWWEEHSGAIERIITRIGDIIRAGLLLIQAIWQEHGDLVKENLALGWDSIKAIFETGATVLTETIEALADLLEGNWAGFFEHLQNITQSWADLQTTIWTNTKDQVVNVVMELIGAVENALGGVDLSGYGQAMIDGLVSGFRSGMDALRDLASEVGDLMSGGLQEELEVESPSRRLAREVGKPSAEGLGLGFLDEMKKQSGALREAVSGALSGLAPGALTGAAGGTTNYNSFLQQVSLPQAPAGFDPSQLLKQMDERTLELLEKVFEGEK